MIVVLDQDSKAELGLHDKGWCSGFSRKFEVGGEEFQVAGTTCFPS